MASHPATLPWGLSPPDPCRSPSPSWQGGEWPEGSVEARWRDAGDFGSVPGRSPSSRPLSSIAGMVVMDQSPVVGSSTGISALGCPPCEPREFGARLAL